MTSRRRSTNTRDGGFSLAEIEAVWRKGKVVPNNDPSVFRKDSCGAWMKRVDYGDTTKYGWEIDHVRPVSRGGGDNLDNLQPLQWGNNRSKGDDWPNWTCLIAS